MSAEAPKTLADVSAGDLVAVSTRSTFRRVAIERTTAHRIVLTDGTSFTRTGRRIGDSTWDTTSIQPWDPAVHDERLARQFLLNEQRDIATRAPLLAQYLRADQTTAICRMLDVAEQARQEAQLRRAATS